MVNRSVCSVIRATCAAYYRGNAGPFAGSPAKGTVSLDALNTLVMDEADRMWIWDLATPLMMSSVLRQHLGDASVFGNLAGSHRRNQRKSERDPLAIEIDSTDALPPIEQNFMRHPAKAKFLCCNGY